LKKKIAGQCPCGYSFEVLSSKNEALDMIQSHVETFHKDFLPFGLTSEEAKMLLKVEYGAGKQGTGAVRNPKSERFQLLEQ